MSLTTVISAFVMVAGMSCAGLVHGASMFGVSGTVTEVVSAAPVSAKPSASTVASGPRIVAAENEFDFGTVPGGQAVEHVFRVKNKGGKPLVITRVKTSCGCTAAMMESSVIDPGEEGRLRVSYNPGTNKGSATRTVSVYSNDPVTPVITFKVRATVAASDSRGGINEPPERPVRTHEEIGELSFVGDCAKCHVPPRRKLKERPLYASVCACCHGEDGNGAKVRDGKVGPPLRLRQMTVKSRAGIRQVISAGTGHPAMPGFSREYGGPLSDKQIDSLVSLVLEGLDREKLKEAP